MASHNKPDGLWKPGWGATFCLGLAVSLPEAEGVDLNRGLVGYWKLQGDAQDYSGGGNHARNRGVDFTSPAEGPEKGGARFDGKGSFLEVPPDPSLELGSGDFSISVWIYTSSKLDDVLGDLLSQYDPARRTGFHLGFMHHAGMTSSQSNYRHVYLGLDAGREDLTWTDCGRPGQAIFICGMCVWEGHLYVGTFETGSEERGHVFRYAGGDRWEDCGSPDPSNAVMSLAVYRNQLYAGTACYRARGSALPDSLNEHPGGHVYRYEGGHRWVDCGRLGDANEVYALAVYNDELYGIPMYSPGVFRFDGAAQWEYCGTPGGLRSMSLAVFNGALYSSGNGGAGVWRYEGGTDWTFCGKQEEETQTYGFAIYQGNLYVGTWPHGSVYRYEGGETWTHCGQLGEEKEVMGMAVYNGQLYGGTLPLAQVYRYDGDHQWTLTGQLDTTPEVVYRRAWTLAVFQGKLFAGTLPSGHVWALEAGKSATYDYELGPGWKHLVAVRDDDRLKLYVEGELKATSGTFAPGDYPLANGHPLKIGWGAQDYFKGSMRELRLYDRALTPVEVEALHADR